MIIFNEVILLYFSIQENLLPGDNLEKKFDNARKLGFDAVEIWGHNIEKRVNEVKSVKDSIGIKISTICSGYPGDLLSLDRSAREQAIKGIKIRLSMAAELDAVGVIVVPTFGGPKLPDLYPLFRDIRDLERKLLIEELKILGRHADNVGAYILIEPLNRYETHFVNRLEQAASICDEVGFEHVKIMGDFFHMNIEEANISESLRKYAEYIKHIHLADSNRLPPGYGHIDFKSAFEVLKEVGYRYYLALECAVPEPKFEVLKKTLSFLRSL